MTKTTHKSRFGRPIIRPHFLLEEYVAGEFATIRRIKKTKSRSTRQIVNAPEKIKKQAKTAKKQTVKNTRHTLEHEGIYETPRSGACWEYEENGSFRPYDSQASDVVEQVYQQWVKNPRDFDVRSVSSGQFSYMVDFRKMTQMNTVHENHTIRNIRRSIY